MIYGSHWNSNASLFKNNKTHSDYLVELDDFITNCKDDFIIHYTKNYDIPTRPPSWMCFELMSFGQLVSLFQNLDDSKSCKTNIVKYFGLEKSKDLLQWMRAFRIIRNICAHHGRLWNRSISTNVQVNPQNMSHSFIQILPANNHKIYASICCIQYLLKIIDKNDNAFGTDLKSLMIQKSQNECIAMGFPIEWEEDLFWS